MSDKATVQFEKSQFAEVLALLKVNKYKRVI